MKKKLYLIPGIMTDKRLWQRLKPYLENDFELIYLKIPLKKSIDEIIDFYNEEIKEEKINLLGFSLGGYLASYFCVKYPEKVDKLFVMASSVCSLNDEEIEQRKNIIELTKKYGFKKLSRKKIESLIEKNTDDKELFSIIENMYMNLGEQNFLNQFIVTLYRKDLSEQMEKLNIPILFFYSLKDNLINTNWLENICLKNKKIVLKKLESTSHMLPLQYPKECSKYIREYFQ